MIFSNKLLDEAIKQIKELDRESFEHYKIFIKLKEKYKQIINKYNKLEEKYSKLKTELKNQNSVNKRNNSIIKDLENRIREYKEIFYEEDSKWEIIGDRIVRFNPTSGEPESIDIPDLDYFYPEQIRGFNFLKDNTWITFKYPVNPRSSYYKKYEMPIPAARKIGINIDNLIANFEINNINQINSEIDLIKYLKKNKIKTDNEYWKSVIEFIINYRGTNFKTKKFDLECKIRNRESPRLYRNQLTKIGLIKRIKKGNFKILFNFD